MKLSASAPTPAPASVPATAPANPKLELGRAPVYEEPLIPHGREGDMVGRRVSEPALPLAELVSSDGLAERSFSLVGYLADGARVRATDVLDAVDQLRSKPGLEQVPLALLGSTPNVYYGVPVQSARQATELLQLAGADPSISFDNVMPDLRALSVADKVLEFDQAPLTAA